MRQYSKGAVKQIPIIDFHTHLFAPGGLNEYGEHTVRRLSSGFDGSFRLMESPTALTNYFRQQGLDYVLVMGLNEMAVGGFVSNDYVANFCRGIKELVPVAFINPTTDPRPVSKEVERCVVDLGMKAVKLTPSYGQYYLSDHGLYPFYETVQSLGVPLIIHTGSSVFPGTRMKYADPLLLDDLAVDFPDLVMVMAHSGRGFQYREADWMARRHPNVYLDITGLPPQNLLTYFPNFEEMAGKIIFGSDWPALPKDIAENIEQIRRLPLSQSALAKVLGENAARLLGYGT